MGKQRCHELSVLELIERLVMAVERLGPKSTSKYIPARHGKWKRPRKRVKR